MNVELLREVQKAILEEPRRLDMAGWGYHSNPNDPDGPPCGTVCCIAGWATVISNKVNADNWNLVSHSYDPSVNNLDLSEDEQIRLFYVKEWPKEIELAYLRSLGPNDRARLAAQRIDMFIKTEGVI